MTDRVYNRAEIMNNTSNKLELKPWRSSLYCIDHYLSAGALFYGSFDRRRI